MARFSKEDVKRVARQLSIPKGGTRGRAPTVQQLRGMFAAGEGVGEMRKKQRRSVKRIKSGGERRGASGSQTPSLGSPKRPRGLPLARAR